MRNVSPRRLQHVQINLHPFYMEPLRKRCYFLKTEQNSTLLTCLLSPAEQMHFGRRQQQRLQRRWAGAKPRSLSSCNGLLWERRLPADKWSISAHVQVLRALPRCPGHRIQFPAGGFVLGIAPTVDILGPVMPDAIVFFWDLQEGPAELFWKESIWNLFSNLKKRWTGDRNNLWVPQVYVSETLSEQSTLCLPAKWCRPSLGGDILKLSQLLRGILPPYGWPRPCSLPRGAWIRVTRLRTKLAALPPPPSVWWLRRCFSKFLETWVVAGQRKQTQGAGILQRDGFVGICTRSIFCFAAASDSPAPIFACLLSPKWNNRRGDRKEKSQQI